MDRYDLQDIARIRLKEARSLLKNGHYHGSYYLAGYAIECSLKACIAKNSKKYAFPDLKTVRDSYSHELMPLFKVAGLWTTFEKDMRNNNDLDINWITLKDWSPEKRYEKSITEQEARGIYSAISNRQNGILQWIRQYW